VVDAPVDRQWEGVKRVPSADEATKGRLGWFCLLVWNMERGRESSRGGMVSESEAKRWASRRYDWRFVWAGRPRHALVNPWSVWGWARQRAGPGLAGKGLAGSASGSRLRCRRIMGMMLLGQGPGRVRRGPVSRDL